MDKLWEFIANGGWVAILVAFIMLMIVLRLIMNNPKYAIKEILKKPWLIFQLFAHAAAETIDLLDDIKEGAEDIKEQVDEVKQAVEETKDAVEDTIDSVK